ncbi:MULTISPECIES: class I SAM-dependent methyltransferase [Mesorhizobium]|uniref:Class I SAM-dependent methyltransferase n=1 Tax=Mesorhizobium denitrificans TaxID=2294114 RepID=A0A371XHA1_9HYPH|nr:MULTISPECIES: class I SAM-dependent methyltransferase [Mesorhizobium]RFC68608.1 class I SAM-dependent methyltransferase [Mesorhizobium denitrificans]
MSRESVQTLFHPFASGELDAPAAGKTCLVFGAERDFQVPQYFDAKLTLVQGFRPDFLVLERRGFSVAPVPDGGNYESAIILAGKHRGQNERWLAESILRLVPGGLIVVAGGKDEGAASLRKRLEKEVPLGGHLSKNHGVVFWLYRSAQADAYADSIVRQQDNALLVDGKFETAPGMFSHDRIDVGSRLLADRLPAGLHGVTADFCAGWGYLSAVLAESSKFSRIDLYEADYASVEAARRNMARLASAQGTNFHWCDLTAERVERIYDLIVMNPPFHAGRAADPALGQALIRAAASALKPRGKLFMVANRGLPYEAILKTQFHACETIADEKGFRVYAATR